MFNSSSALPPPFSPPLPSPLTVTYPPYPTGEPAVVVAEETRPVREVVRPRLAPPPPSPFISAYPPFPLPSPAPSLKGRTTSPVRALEPRAFWTQRVIVSYSPELRLERPRRMCQKAFETQTTTSPKNAAREQWLQSWRHLWVKQELCGWGRGETVGARERLHRANPSERGRGMG